MSFLNKSGQYYIENPNVYEKDILMFEKSFKDISKAKKEINQSLQEALEIYTKISTMENIVSNSDIARVKNSIRSLVKSREDIERSEESYLKSLKTFNGIRKILDN